MAIAFQVTASAHDQGSGTATTLAMDTSLYDLFVIVASSATNPTPTDSYNNTWIGLTARTVSGMTVRIWYCNPPSGKHGPGHTFSLAGGTTSIHVSCYTGAEQVSVFDVENGSTSASASSLATGSITPGSNNELLVTGVAANNQVTINSVDSGFGIFGNATGTATSFSTALAFLIETTATAKNPTWTIASANLMAVAIASFRAQVAHLSPTGASLALTGAVPGRDYTLYPNTGSLSLIGKTPHFPPVDGPVQVTIGGVDHTNDVEWGTEIIRDVLNQPSTISFVAINGFNPATGSVIQIKRGTIILFKGAVTTSKQTYAGLASNPRYNITCIDETYFLRKKMPFGSYVNVSATNVAGDIVTRYSTFGTDGIQGGLPEITIAFDGSKDLDKCLTDICQLVGASHYTGDDDIVYLFTPSGAEAIPNITDSTTNVLLDPPLTVTRELSQLRNRVYIKGAQVATVAASIGDNENIIPVSSADSFNVAGGFVFVVPADVISYSTIDVGGGTSLVGPGTSPTTPPTVSLLTGTGLNVGQYQYAEVFVTAQGKTKPSPVASIATIGTSTLPNPTGTPTLYFFDNYVYYGTGSYPNYNATDTRGPHIGDTVQYAISFSTSATDDLLHETALSPPTAAVVVPASQFAAQYGITCAVLPQVDYFAVTNPYGQSGGSDFNTNLYNSGITFVHVWRKTNGGAYTLVSGMTMSIFQVAYNPSLWQDLTGAVGGSVPSANATLAAKQSVSVIPTIGPTGTTSREIYRTAVGGSQLKLLTTYANNTDTSPFTDTVADGSLGANAPTGDTSGLAFAISNGGGFYTTSSVIFPTDGAATSATSGAPSFTSASYTFVSADIGATIYIKSGTNWISGRYLITNVVAGAAILAGACASVSSPTSATWGIDYSTLTDARIAFTDMVIDASNAAKFTSAAHPVGVNFIGNVVSVSNTIGFIEQRVIVLSTSGTVATCDKNIGTFSATGGIGNLGGSPPATSVAVGSTTMLVRDISQFNDGGGWVDSGSQQIRYSGISTTTASLTGIPATGIGSITSAISYGDSATALPALLGCSNVLAVAKSTPLRLFVRRDNVSAQTAQAIIEGGDGIHESTIDDTSLTTEQACNAVGDADLTIFSTSIVTVEFASRETTIHSGKTVTINRTTPSVTGTYTIQDVTVTQLWVKDGPLFSVKASNTKFTLQDLLAQVANLFRSGLS